MICDTFLEGLSGIVIAVRISPLTTLDGSEALLHKNINVFLPQSIVEENGLNISIDLTVGAIRKLRVRQQDDGGIFIFRRRDIGGHVKGSAESPLDKSL